MASPTYVVEILDNTRTPITQIKAFVPLNNKGDLFSYSSRLSDAGMAHFRVATLAPELSKYGDILQPWANHIRISRDGFIVWQGVIIDAPHRTSKYIEVMAYTYLEEWKKVLVAHKDGDNGEDTRNFKSGSMVDALTAIINEAKASATGRVIQGVTLGTLQNPNFPAGYTDINGSNIGGGGWTFSDNFKVSFDFKDTLYVIGSFANYCLYDFELTKDLVFNFQRRIGVDKPELLFEFAQYGMIEDFDSPFDGKNQANHLIGIAADSSDNILKLDPSDTSSVTRYGKLDGVAAFNDVKNKDVLQSRLQEELRLNSTPDAELRLVLNERAYPVGIYGLGDTCTFKIVYGAIKVNELRQIIAIATSVHNTGKEHIILTTNKPRIYQ